MVVTSHQPTLVEPLDEQVYSKFDVVEEGEPTQLRHTQREKKQPLRFTFDKAYGYHVAKCMMNTILLGACFLSGICDAQYLDSFMLNEDGTLTNVLPHCSNSFKASKKKEPDTPNMKDSMSGPHKEEIKEAMKTEVNTLDDLGT